VDELEVQLDEEVFAAHRDGLVVDDATEADLLQRVEAVQVVTQLAAQRQVVEQAQHGGERLHVLPVEVVHQGAQLGDLLGLHGERVGARAQDGVQQQHQRRVLGVVRRAVLEAEVEVVQERAVGVLHVEVALVRHEAQQRRVHLGQLRAMSTACTRAPPRHRPHRPSGLPSRCAS
jgi:hypothetical protein